MTRANLRKSETTESFATNGVFSPPELSIYLRKKGSLLPTGQLFSKFIKKVSKNDKKMTKIPKIS